MAYTNGNINENLFISIYSDEGHSSEKEDKEMGFDCRVLGVPVDATLNFENKDHMQKLGEFRLDRSVSFKFGVRTGNNHRGFTAFDEPVLVVGLDFPSLQWLDLAEDAMFRRRKEVKQSIYNLYWDWMEEHPEYDPCVA